MIAQLQGRLLEKPLPTVVLDVQGVGYEVEVPMSTAYRLPDIGGDCTLLTQMIVREDAQLLYGFAEREERQLFRELIKVSGVGPKLALAILSGMSSDDFVATVQQEDAVLLTKIPGVGKKTAERLVVEMKDRLKAWTGGVAAGATVAAGTVKATVNASAEAEHALLALGYKPAEITRMLKAIGNTDELSSEAIIKQALQSVLKR